MSKNTLEALGLNIDAINARARQWYGDFNYWTPAQVKERLALPDHGYELWRTSLCDDVRTSGEARIGSNQFGARVTGNTVFLIDVLTDG